MEELKIPKHIGFIMDGNGRWAKQRGKSRNYGHQKGADVIEEIAESCYRRGVQVVSLYAFSTENWSRPQDEIDTIFDLLRKFIKKYSAKLVKEHIKLIVSGDMSKLPEELRKECEKRIEITKDFDGTKILNIAMNYGSRTEITRAVNLIINDGKKEVTEDEVSSYLYTAGLPDMDLVVRTSGEMRLSNFFLWQCAYAELYFTDCLWPDFHLKELNDAIQWFSNRKRRFGGV